MSLLVRRLWIVAVLVSALGVLSPAMAEAASFSSITASADPTEEIPVTVTVSGSTETARTLYVFYKQGTGACANTAYNEDVTATELSGTSSGYVDGDAVATGSFSKNYSFTPANSGSYRICAYL